jgi:hypothetical protein
MPGTRQEVRAMNADQALKECRDVAKELNRLRTTRIFSDYDNEQRPSIRLVDAFDALDEWMSKGQPLPEEWRSGSGEALKELALRLLIRLYPCKLCRFELAKMAQKDVVFGVGEPELCPRCARERVLGQDEEWVSVDSHIPKLLRPDPPETFAR